MWAFKLPPLEGMWVAVRQKSLCSRRYLTHQAAARLQGPLLALSLWVEPIHQNILSPSALIQSLSLP